MKIAIMQPYIFPYIGYFQLIHSVDKFVFLDNVNFIKKGWINRNRLMINKNVSFFTIPCKNISQNKKINEINIDWESNFLDKMLRTIEFNYKKAPFFNTIIQLIFSVFEKKYSKISQLAIESVIKFCNYLEMSREFIIASEKNDYNHNLKSADRLIDIAQKENCKTYINAIGGLSLYNKDYFSKKSIDLYFLKTNLNENFDKNNYISFLSIIDLAMFNSVDKIKFLLQQYELI